MRSIAPRTVPIQPRVHRAWLPTLAALLLWTGALGASVTYQAAPADAARTVNDGVYTSAQADRGQAVFGTSCTVCHDPARFTGDEFLGVWTGKPLRDLFQIISTTMPEDNPGGLKPQQYADVVAYFLKLNQFPAGREELKPSADAMAGVTIAKRGRAP